jgi:hypothetical protein
MSVQLEGSACIGFLMLPFLPPNSQPSRHSRIHVSGTLMWLVIRFYSCFLRRFLLIMYSDLLRSINREVTLLAETERAVNPSTE